VEDDRELEGGKTEGELVAGEPGLEGALPGLRAKGGGPGVSEG
jgi:hypothetical protein